MEKEFIPYQEALAMKELGYYTTFRVGALSVLYNKDGKLTYYANFGMYDSGMGDGYICAPLWQQAFRFFREKYDLHFTIESIEGADFPKMFNCLVYKHGGRPVRLDDKRFHEQQQLAVLQYLIKIVKNENSSGRTTMGKAEEL